MSRGGDVWGNVLLKSVWSINEGLWLQCYQPVDYDIVSNANSVMLLGIAW